MQVYAVREVTSYLRELLEANPHLGDLWIAGEVSNVSRPASGHVYFTLKDPASQLRAVFFAPRYTRTSTGHLIQNGHAIVAHGRISLYEQRGEMQIAVDFVQPEGAGALQLEYERLKARLEAEGLFDAKRKRPLPRFPRKIGVVTSESGAVFHDICHVLARRWPLAEVVLAPAPVQGSEAVPAILAAIARLNQAPDVDVIIVGRGGGSIEELWAFNDEALAHGIFASEVPIVSAVGHETDFTISDFVADCRAPTPSAAAEMVSPERGAVASHISDAGIVLGQAVRDRVAACRSSVAHSRQAMDHRVPDVNHERQRIDDLTRRADGCVDGVLRRSVQSTGSCTWRLKALDPYATLDRGYAIVQRGTAVISSVAQPKTGDKLDIRVRDGVFEAAIGGAARIQRKRAKRSVPDAQAPLFTMPEERA